MNMVNLQDAINRLLGCRDSGDGSTLPKLLQELDVNLLLHEERLDSFFDGLLGLLDDRKFLALEESWHLAYLINNHWDELTTEQRERLRTILAGAFDRFRNWMGAFVTAEIFGDHCADERGFNTLRGLSETANLPSRALVPHGLVCLVRSATDERLRASAVELLRDLSTDENEQVRDEAIISLRDLDLEI